MDLASSARPTEGSKWAPRPAPFRAFSGPSAPPPQGKPFTAVFLLLAAAVPAGTAQGFLSPGPGRSFFRVQIQTKKMGGCGVHSVESTLWTRGLGRRLSKAPGPPLPSGGGVAFKAQVTAMEATHRELNLR